MPKAKEAACLRQPLLKKQFKILTFYLPPINILLVLKLPILKT
jgi:hypothetical protein